MRIIDRIRRTRMEVHDHRQTTSTRHATEHMQAQVVADARTLQR